MTFITALISKLKSTFSNTSKIDCLVRIMESFQHKRSKKAVINRMIELGLIADRSEILPIKRGKRQKNHTSNVADNYISSDDEDSSSGAVKSVESKTFKKKLITRKKKTTPMRHISKKTVNVEDLHKKMAEMDDNLKIHIKWIQESLNDAAEDFEYDEEPNDPNDGVPIVPFSLAQKQALENPKFKNLLLDLGLQEPLQNMVSVRVLNYSFF